MSERRVPVPRRLLIPVEGEASGAAPFDGNHTNDVISWLFANEHWEDEAADGMLLELMEHTKWGHLAWVVFPPYGFRL